MLNALVERSLRLAWVVVVLACIVLALGVYASIHARLDVFPEFVPPQVVVQTEAPGFSAEQVETLVTRPIEARISGAGSLESMRSQSIQGLSAITAIFKDRTDVFRARQQLSEQLAGVIGELPIGAREPKMTPLTSSTMDLLKIGLLSDKLSPMELRTFAQWTMRPRLVSVPGVSNVSLFGGEVRQIQLQVLPQRLEALQLSIDDVLDAARNATGVRGAGFVENENQRVVVQTEGQFTTAAALSQIVLARRAGRSIVLGDVARVVDAPEPRFGDALIMGKPGVLVTMLSQYGANTMEVTRGVEAALAELRPALDAESITLYPRLHRPATFIEYSVANLRDSLVAGAILVAIVLFLFLYNVRTAFISLTAIPLSLCVAIAVMHQWGATLNTITLGGLAIALGEVVDDAIIDVENIFRRLRENERLGRPRSAFRVVLDASIEVRSAVVYATFVVALVFVPVLTMSGLQGRLFAPLGQAYLLAIMASLLVALTVTPALSLLLLPRAAGRARELWLLVRARDAYRSVLAFLARHTAFVALGALAICGGAWLVVSSLGSEFVPEFREGHFVLQVTQVPGTSIQETRRIGKQISDALLANPHIATVEQQIGRAELDADTFGPHRSEFHIELQRLPPDVEAGVQGEIRAVLTAIPGISFNLLTFLGDRIGESISGETAAVVVSVYGDDLDLIDAKAAEVSRVIESVRGAVDVQSGSLPGAPAVDVGLRADRMRALGFQPVRVLDAVQTAFQGEHVAQIWEGSRVTDLVVVLAPEFRRDPESVAALRVRNAEGASVALSAIADVTQASSRYMLLHDGGRRRQTVTCNVSGRDVASFVDEARAKVATQVAFPRGTYAVFGGAAEQEAKARSELLLHSSIALAGILILLGIVFGSARNLALVLVNLPFALAGGLIAARITGGTISIGSLVGFVTLFGITTRNSIMMVSHFEHLVSHEGMTWGLEAALRGASERFVPIVMTALVTGLGLLPLAIESGKAGREIEGPMAAVILGGLFTSTLLNLLVLPSLALKFGRFAVARENADEAG
jgi:CzcA family heavy metal efflux pump